MTEEQARIALAGGLTHHVKSRPDDGELCGALITGPTLPIVSAIHRIMSDAPGVDALRASVASGGPAARLAALHEQWALVCWRTTVSRGPRAGVHGYTFAWRARTGTVVFFPHDWVCMSPDVALACALAAAVEPPALAELLALPPGDGPWVLVADDEIAAAALLGVPFATLAPDGTFKNTGKGVAFQLPRECLLAIARMCAAELREPAAWQGHVTFDGRPPDAAHMKWRYPEGAPAIAASSLSPIGANLEWFYSGPPSRQLICVRLMRGNVEWNPGPWWVLVLALAWRPRVHRVRGELPPFVTWTAPPTHEGRPGAPCAFVAAPEAACVRASPSALRGGALANATAVRLDGRCKRPRCSVHSLPTSVSAAGPALEPPWFAELRAGENRSQVTPRLGAPMAALGPAPHPAPGSPRRQLAAVTAPVSACNQKTISLCLGGYVVGGNGDLTHYGPASGSCCWCIPARVDDAWLGDDGGLCAGPEAPLGALALLRVLGGSSAASDVASAVSWVGTLKPDSAAAIRVAPWAAAPVAAPARGPTQLALPPWATIRAPVPTPGPSTAAADTASGGYAALMATYEYRWHVLTALVWAVLALVFCLMVAACARHVVAPLIACWTLTHAPHAEAARLFGAGVTCDSTQAYVLPESACTRGASGLTCTVRDVGLLSFDSFPSTSCLHFVGGGRVVGVLNATLLAYDLEPTLELAYYTADIDVVVGQEAKCWGDTCYSTYDTLGAMLAMGAPELRYRNGFDTRDWVLSWFAGLAGGSLCAPTWGYSGKTDDRCYGCGLASCGFAACALRLLPPNAPPRLWPVYRLTGWRVRARVAMTLMSEGKTSWSGEIVTGETVEASPWRAAFTASASLDTSLAAGSCLVPTAAGRAWRFAECAPLGAPSTGFLGDVQVRPLSGDPAACSPPYCDCYIRTANVAATRRDGCNGISCPFVAGHVSTWAASGASNFPLAYGPGTWRETTDGLATWVPERGGGTLHFSLLDKSGSGVVLETVADQVCAVATGCSVTGACDSRAAATGVVTLRTGPGCVEGTLHLGGGGGAIAPAVADVTSTPRPVAFSLDIPCGGDSCWILVAGSRVNCSCDVHAGTAPFDESARYVAADSEGGSWDGDLGIRVALPGSGSAGQLLFLLLIAGVVAALCALLVCWAVRRQDPRKYVPVTTDPEGSLELQPYPRRRRLVRLAD